MLGELFSGLVNVVSTVLKPVVSIIQTTVGVVAKCGTYVTEKVAEFIGAVDPNCGGLCSSLKEASNFLNNVGDYLLKVGRNLNIDELKECSCESLGAKVLLPETREREVDEPVLNYIDYLNGYELDEDEFGAWPLEKRVASTAIGNALVAEAITETTGVEIPVSFLTNMEKAQVKHDEVASLIEQFNIEGKESMSELNDFLENAPDLTETEAEKMEAIAIEALKNSDSDMSDEVAMDKLKQIKIAVQE